MHERLSISGSMLQMRGGICDNITFVGLVIDRSTPTTVAPEGTIRGVTTPIILDFIVEMLATLTSGTSQAHLRLRKHRAHGESLFEKIFQTLYRGHPYRPTRSNRRETVESLRQDFRTLVTLLDKSRGRFRQDPLIKAVNMLGWRCCQNLQARRLCLTSKGLIGLVPKDVQIGDVVAVIKGAPIPFILRKAGAAVLNEDRYALIGHAYIHNIMHGEATEMADYREQDIVLI